MAKYKQKNFNKFLIKSKAIQFLEEPITLASGRETPLYFNMRVLTNSIRKKDKLLNFMLQYIEGREIQTQQFLGVPEGGTKLGLFLQDAYQRKNIKWYNRKDYNLTMGRGKEKQHGKPEDKYLIGSLEDKVILLEDVMTTGNSVFAYIDKLKEMNIETEAVITLLDRQEKTDNGNSVRRNMHKKGITFYSLTESSLLMPMALRKLRPKKKVKLAVEEYYQKWGAYN